MLYNTTPPLITILINTQVLWRPKESWKAYKIILQGTTHTMKWLNWQLHG